MSDVNNWAIRSSERIREPFYVRNGPNQKRQINASLRMLLCTAAKGSIRVQEVVLHIHNQKCRPVDVRSHRINAHWSLPCFSLVLEIRVTWIGVTRIPGRRSGNLVTTAHRARVVEGGFDF